jgi:hypothetical protein
MKFQTTISAGQPGVVWFCAPDHNSVPEFLDSRIFAANILAIATCDKTLRAGIDDAGRAFSAAKPCPIAECISQAMRPRFKCSLNRSIQFILIVT